MLGLFDQLEPPSVEHRTTLLSGRLVNYTLKRTGRRRSIGLRIDDDGLTVAMPERASEKWLNSVLQEKAGWIVEKLESWQSRKPVATQWIDGQFIKFIGEPLTLRVVASLFSAPPLLQGRQLYVHVTQVTDQAAIRQEVEQWYRQQAETLFRQRVSHFSALMGVTPSTVNLSSARTQWGSCTAQGSVRLNWQLIRMPLRLIDYVVAHELAHLIELNHSPAFWRVVARACPDYARRRAELRSQPLIE
ncbi:MAG: M48 family metallopeptidase [Gallionellaceae bacterium]|jgi:predicted metal-dependent hydrolase|nr:M48 family metallopeptidase [Gallionellaceae bacterium]